MKLIMPHNPKFGHFLKAYYKTKLKKAFFELARIFVMRWNVSPVCERAFAMGGALGYPPASCEFIKNCENS